MTWTQFHDMNSGGGRKEKWSRIYIEAPEDEARAVFVNRFGHNPDRVSCTCCGPDYSVSEDPSLEQASGYERNCDNLETPRDEDGHYKQPDDPWFHEHYWIEPGEEAEAEARGWTVKKNTAYEIGQKHGSNFGKYQTLLEYVNRDDVLVIYADDIKPEERSAEIREQGYVWVD